MPARLALNVKAIRGRRSLDRERKTTALDLEKAPDPPAYLSESPRSKWVSLIPNLRRDGYFDQCR